MLQALDAQLPVSWTDLVPLPHFLSVTVSEQPPVTGSPLAKGQVGHLWALGMSPREATALEVVTA